MCNACGGFVCCALDTFDKCGCDCRNPECWDDDCRVCGFDEDNCICDDSEFDDEAWVPDSEVMV